MVNKPFTDRVAAGDIVVLGRCCRDGLYAGPDSGCWLSVDGRTNIYYVQHREETRMMDAEGWILRI